MKESIKNSKEFGTVMTDLSKNIIRLTQHNFSNRKKSIKVSNG